MRERLQACTPPAAGVAGPAARRLPHAAHCLGLPACCRLHADVEEGGETAFPHSRWLDRERQTAGAKYSDCAKDGVAALPRKGNAIMFWDTKVGVGRPPASPLFYARFFMIWESKPAAPHATLPCPPFPRLPNTQSAYLHETWQHGCLQWQGAVPCRLASGAPASATRASIQHWAQAFGLQVGSVRQDKYSMHAGETSISCCCLQCQSL